MILEKHTVFNQRKLSIAIIAPLVLLLWVGSCLTVGPVLAQEVFSRRIIIHTGDTTLNFYLEGATATPDNGFVAIGNSFLSHHFLFPAIIKVGATGIVEWVEKLVLPSGFTLVDVSVDSIGAILFAGYHFEGMVIGKCTAAGKLIFCTNYNLSLNNRSHFHIPLSDGGILFSNTATHGYGFLCMLNNQREVEWYTCHDLFLCGHIVAGLEGKNKDCYVVGSPLFDDGLGIYIEQLDKRNGGIRRCISGSIANMDIYPTSIIETSDGSLIVGGSIKVGVFPTLQFPFLIKLDTLLNVQWFISVNFLSTLETIAQLQEGPSGNILLTTTLLPSGTRFIDSCCHIAEYTPTGNVITAKAIHVSSMPTTSLFLHRSKDEGYSGVGSIAQATDSATCFFATLNSSLQGCISSQCLVNTSFLRLKVFEASQSFSSSLNKPRADDLSVTVKMLASDSADYDCFQTISKVNQCQPLPSSIVRLYPNPAPHGHEIQIYTTVASGSYHVMVRNITGNSVFRSTQQLYTEGYLTIPTIGLASGIYTVELAEANSFATIWRAKVVVQ